MKTLTALGRFIFAIPFIIFGLNHFMHAPEMAGMVLKNWPIAEGLVYIVGLALILAGVSIIINVKARLASLLLALLLFIFIVTLHLPSLLHGNSSSLVSLLKDMALMGASLTYAGILKK
jgi:putative oxidoreductase